MVKCCCNVFYNMLALSRRCAMAPGRKTGKEESGSTWSREKFEASDDGSYGGSSAHVTHWSNDGKGNSERTSSDLTPSPSGGWQVSETHTTKQ